MEPSQQRVLELSAEVKADPASVPRRLELAAALRDLGRVADAVALYHAVGVHYASASRFAQAIAVCRDILEIDPSHRPTRQLLDVIASGRAGARRPVSPTPLWMQAIDVASATPDAAPSTLNQSARGAAPPSPSSPLVDAFERSHAAEKPASEIARFEAESPIATSFDVTAHGAVTAVATAAAGGLPELAIGMSERELPPDGASLLAGALHTPWPVPDSSEPPPFPLLSDLPRAAFLDLVTRIEVRRVAAGGIVVREGDHGDAFFLITAGTMRVVKGGIEVARLGAGAFFGEFAVLADQRRHASVEAVTTVELLEISRALLDELIAAHPGVARTLRRFYGERLMETLTATAPFFAPLGGPERAEVAVRFRPRRFGRGARIIEQGQPGGGLFLILIGEVEIVSTDAGFETALAVLGEGSYFGEMSLLTGGMASATVRALKTVEAVQLGPRDFYEVMSAHPVLWDALRNEAARRELANHAIIAGETRQGGDGSIYLV